MFKSIVGLMIVGVALVPFTSSQRHRPDQRVAPTQIVSRAATAPAHLIAQQFTLNSPTGKTCKLEKFDNKSDRSFSVVADNGCDDVHAGLSQAVSWVDGTQGSAHIVAKDGKVLLNIGPSDGFAYESIDSGSEIITLE